MDPPAVRRAPRCRERIMSPHQFRRGHSGPMKSWHNRIASCKRSSMLPILMKHRGSFRRLRVSSA